MFQHVLTIYSNSYVYRMSHFLGLWSNVTEIGPPTRHKHTQPLRTTSQMWPFSSLSRSHGVRRFGPSKALVGPLRTVFVGLPQPKAGRGCGGTRLTAKPRQFRSGHSAALLMSTELGSGELHKADRIQKGQTF